MEDFHNKVARLCLKHYETLPKTGKPNPKTEWTVLSCIVMEVSGGLRVVALGTGSKCIGRSKMRASGDVLNDSHAEVVCRRSFLRFLYFHMGNHHQNSTVFECYDKNTNKFRLNRDVKFHFFTTQVPCGDAAIFPTKQDNECCFGEALQDVADDGIPAKKKVRIDNEGDVFRTGAKCLENGGCEDAKLPGGGYHVLGVVRTKPGRGDPTLSVSCSDKISKWCHLGLQGALLSILLEKPIYLSSFIVASKTPFSAKAVQRSLYNRLGEVKLEHPYSQKKVDIVQCSEEFEFGKVDGKLPCPSSISWCDIEEKRLEVSVDGKRQGVTKKKANSQSARLKICKLELFKEFLKICDAKNITLVRDGDNHSLTYASVKYLAREYQKSWKVLRKSFKMWTRKDENLIKFYVDE